MRNALILHGTGSSSFDHWFPWLKKKLQQKGYKVYLPDLPFPFKPSMQRWSKFIFKNWQFDSDSIIIGHSAGATAILGILQGLPESIIIKKAIMVAGFTDNLGREDLDELFDIRLDFDKIKQSCREFILIHSDDDPAVPFFHAEHLKKKLNAKLIVLKGQKHFSISDPGGEKYFKFPEILKKL